MGYIFLEDKGKHRKPAPEMLAKVLELVQTSGKADAEQLINEGWQYVGTLPNGKIIVKK